MAIVARGLVSQAEIDREVARVVALLGPEVVRVKHTLEEDTSGDLSLYFRIVLTDEAAAQIGKGNLTAGIREKIDEELHPLERWNLFPYVTFRSESDQARSADEAWA